MKTDTLLQAGTGRSTDEALFARGLNAALADGATLKRIMWMPEGTHQIVCKHKDGFAAVTVRVDAATAATAQRSFSELLEAEAPQKPFCDAFHDHNAATIWPVTPKPGEGGPLAFTYEAGRGVILEGEPTKYGAEMISGKTCRTFSPGFYTDAKIEASGPKRYGVKPGQRGSPQNPAAVTGVAFYVGSLVNDPAFKDMEAFFASTAETNHGGTPPTKEQPMTPEELAAKQAAEKQAILEAENARLKDENKKQLEAIQGKREADMERALQAAIQRGAVAPKDDKSLGRYRDLAKKGVDAVEIVDALEGSAKGRTPRIVAPEAGESGGALHVEVGDAGLHAAGKAFVEARNGARLTRGQQGDHNALDRALEASARGNRIFARDIAPLMAKDAGIRVRDMLEAADATDANLGTLTGTLVLQQSLPFLKNILFPVSRVTTNISAQPLQFGQTVMTRLRLPLAVKTWDAMNKTFTTKATPQNTDVSITIDQFKSVPISFTVDTLGATMRNLFQEFAEPMTFGLAEQVNKDILALITAGNFASSVTVDLATFSAQSLPSIKLALTKNKVPLGPGQRTLLLLSDLHDKLLEDTSLVLAQTVKAGLKGGEDTLGAGTLPELFGMLPLESQLMTDGAKLVGFAFGASALAFGSRIPADYTKVWSDLPATGVIDMVTEPDSGLTLMMRRYVLHDSWSADADVALMYGQAKGQGAAGIRLVTK